MVSMISRESVPFSLRHARPSEAAARFRERSRNKATAHRLVALRLLLEVEPQPRLPMAPIHLPQFRPVPIRASAEAIRDSTQRQIHRWLSLIVERRPRISHSRRRRQALVQWILLKLTFKREFRLIST